MYAKQVQLKNICYVILLRLVFLSPMLLQFSVLSKRASMAFIATHILAHRTVTRLFRSTPACTRILLFTPIKIVRLVQTLRLPFIHRTSVQTGIKTHIAPRTQRPFLSPIALLAWPFAVALALSAGAVSPAIRLLLPIPYVYIL